MENTMEMVANVAEPTTEVVEAVATAAKNWEMSDLGFVGWSIGCAGLGALITLGVQYLIKHKPEKKTKLGKKLKRGVREAKEAVTDTVEDVTDAVKDKLDEFTEA